MSLENTGPLDMTGGLSSMVNPLEVASLNNPVLFKVLIYEGMEHPLQTHNNSRLLFFGLVLIRIIRIVICGSRFCNL